MAREIPSASLGEGVKFTLLVALPNVIQGLFRRRPRMVALATRLDVDRRAVGVVGALRSRHGHGAVWVRLLAKRVLLVMPGEDLRRVLEGSPDPYAADPEPKKKGMSHFQPDALTISRGELWQNRRRFNEAVLGTGSHVHRLGDRFVTVTREEADALLALAEGAGGLEWGDFNETVRRITRRVILGDGARDDTEVTELLETLMSEANKMPKEKSERFAPFMAMLEEYAERGEEGSLAGLFADAPHDGDTKTAGQVPHWMFALGDTLAINAFRALALLATHGRQASEVEDELEAVGMDRLGSAEGVMKLHYLDGCLEEAMRIWPTTTMLSRETTADTSIGESVVPKGTQVMISNVFNHRDLDGHEFADRFAPEAWTDGDAADDWSFNQFSHGPQGCPGTGIAKLVGKSLLSRLLEQRQFRLLEPTLEPGRPLPHMLDFFKLRFATEPR